MHELWSMHRNGPQPQALHFGYEKAGLTLHDQPIPWNAEAVLVDAALRAPIGGARRLSDFQMRLGRQELVSPQTSHRDESDGRHHLRFRFPTPRQSVIAELLYRSHTLSQMTLPVISREDFLSRLELDMPTLFVRLGEQCVACQTFVATQSRGFLASAVISSPSSLVPLLDLGLHVDFRSERGGTLSSTPARLSSSQLAGNRALITVVPRRFPRRSGAWRATWVAGDQPLATVRLHGISQRHFQRSLRVADTRFVIQRKKQGVSVTQHVPPLDEIARVGPCFIVSSKEPGMAGLCTLQVRTQAPGALPPPLLVEEEILITDGPTMFAPGTVDVADLGRVTAFELRCKSGVLGTLPLCPAPTASFNAEGAFKESHEFPWSAAAEEELNDRLTRLLEGHSG
jgi:hypothetical protein